MTEPGMEDVRFCHIADIDADDEHVRFWGKADIPETPHQCPLMTLSGHQLAHALELRAKGGQRVPERFARDYHHATKRLVEFQNQEDCPRD